MEPKMDFRHTQALPRSSKLVLIVLLLLASSQLRAEVVINGNAPFIRLINTCFELIDGAGGESKKILDRLRQPRPQSKRHVIQHSSLNLFEMGVTIPNKSGPQKIQPGGSPGAGSGSIIAVDFFQINLFEMGDNFCAILMHELKHAYDMNNGELKNTQRPRPEPGAGIPDSEIDAVREQNRFLKHYGRPQVTEYNGIPVPPDAIF